MFGITLCSRRHDPRWIFRALTALTVAIAIPASSAPGAGRIIKVFGLNFNTTAGAPFTGPVALINTNPPFTNPGVFSADIQWGDGVRTTAAIRAGVTPGSFEVVGSHVYTSPGDRTVLTRIQKAGSPPKTFKTQCTAQVEESHITATGREVTPDPERIDVDRFFISVAQDLGLQVPVGDSPDVRDGDDNAEFRLDLVRVLLSTFEYRAQLVQGLYQKFLGRDADPVGMVNFQAILESGGSPEDIIAILVGSAEYFETRGMGTIRGFLEAVYNDILNRPPDPAGLNFWRGLIRNGASLASVAHGIAVSPEATTNRIESIYEQFLNRPPLPVEIQFWATAGLEGFLDHALMLGLLASDEYFERAITPVKAGEAFRRPVASFTDGNPFLPAVQYQATIDWGDGTTSEGIIQSNPFGGYLVIGEHTYDLPGTYRVAVDISSSLGGQALAVSTAFIVEPGS